MSGTLEQSLWKAIEDQDFRKARILLRNGVQTDKLLEDGTAVIHILSGFDGKEANQLLKEFLENGASPNVPSCKGITPVHVAAIWGLYDNLCTLIEYGGSVDARDFEGMSPLDYAMQSYESQADLCVKLLSDLEQSKTVNQGLVISEEGACSFENSDECCNPQDKIGEDSSVVRRTNYCKVLDSNKTESRNSNCWNAESKQHTYTRVKSKPDSVSANRKENTRESLLSVDAINGKKHDRPTRDISTYKLGVGGQCYIDETDFMTEDETSSMTPNRTSEGNESLLSVDDSHVNNPTQITRGSSQPWFSSLYGHYYIDGRDFLTDDESISGSQMSANSLSSFYTANEGEISMAFSTTLDDTVVSFPKLHPWTASQNQMDLEETFIDSINNLDIKNSSEKLNCTSFINSCSANNTLCDGTVLYDWKEYSILEIPSSCEDSDVSFAIPETLLTMGCQKLREELLKLGDDPGPIRADTRMLYVRRLARLQYGLTDMKSSDRLKEYLPEVRAVIEGRLPSSEMDPAEESMCVEFTKNNLRSKWREGTEKSSFNYLLLDPRVTQNLPVRSKKMAYEDIFHTFVAAIFYVGKGKRSRPYAHLHEAVNLNKTNRKLQQIRDIWAAGLGVVSIHCFQGVIPVEAYTREACLVEALGLARLTNQKRCDYYGRAKSWGLKKKRQMGVYLLKRALQIFLNEGERQMRPEDLRRQ